MLEVEACDKALKRPSSLPSSPRNPKRPGKEPSVSGPSVVEEARRTSGSTSEPVVENDSAALDSVPSSSFSSTLCKMDTIALGSEDVTHQERYMQYGALNARPAVSTCSSNFDSHAGIRDMNINRYVTFSVGMK